MEKEEKGDREKPSHTQGVERSEYGPSWLDGQVRVKPREDRREGGGGKKR